MFHKPFSLLLLTLVASLMLVQLGPVMAQDEAFVFAYQPPPKDDAITFYHRGYRRYANAQSEAGFAKGPWKTNARFRYMAIKEPDGANAVIQMDQQQQNGGSGNEWVDASFVWFPAKGRYVPDEDGTGLRVYKSKQERQEIPLAEDEMKKVQAFFAGDPFFDRMGRFLDQRRFYVGEKIDPGADLDAILGLQNPTQRQMWLDGVETRWGRRIARFFIEAKVETAVPLSRSWILDIDAETGRILRSTDVMITDQAIRQTDQAGKPNWLRAHWYNERHYGFDSLVVDRSAFELVNPGFLAPGGASVRDLAYLSKSDALVLMEEGKPDFSGKSQTALGLMKLQDQRVAKVLKSFDGEHIFAARNRDVLMKANTGISLDSYLLQQDGFSPFGNYLRYPKDEKLTAWGMLGVYGAVGTSSGKIGFINTGWNEEAGVHPVASAPIVGIDALAEDKRVVSLDGDGHVRLHDLAFEDMCKDRPSMDAFCKGLVISLGAEKADIQLDAKACLAEMGESLRLVPGRQAVLWVEHALVAQGCEATGTIHLLDLKNGERRRLAGTAFAVTRDGGSLVTASGLYAFAALDKPVLAFNRLVDDVRKIELAEAQSLALLLNREGAVYPVDLRSGVVLEDLASQRDFPSPAAVLARIIWQQRYIALMSDGTLIMEHPESRATQFVALEPSENRSEAGSLTQGLLLPSKEALFAVVRGKDQSSSQTEDEGWAEIFRINLEGTVAPVGRFRVSADQLSHVVMLRDGRLYLKGDLALHVLGPWGASDQAMQALEAKDYAYEMNQIVHPTFGILPGKGAFKDHLLLLERQLDFTTKPASFKTALVVAKPSGKKLDIVHTYHLPDRFGWTQAPHPLALSRSGRYVAVANLSPPKGGHWNENGRIISVLDLMTGESAYEFFPDWGLVSAMAFSPNDKQLLVGKADGQFLSFDLESGLKRAEFTAHFDQITAIEFDGERVVTRGADRTMRVWDLRLIDLEPQFGQLVDQLFGSSLGLPNWEFLLATSFDPLWDPVTHAFEGTATISSDGYYASDKNRLGRIQFIDGNGSAINLADADLRRNRPDIALARAAMISTERQQLLADLYQKRLLEFGLTAPPQPKRDSKDLDLDIRLASPLVTEAAQASFVLSVPDAGKLQSLTIRNNGVPVARFAAHAIGGDLSIPLEPGVNRVMFDGRDGDGNKYGLAQWTLRRLELESDPPPRLYIFAVGVSRYADKGLDLKYAAKDAGDLARYFADQPNTVIETVTDGQATVAVIERARRFFAQARPQDRTLFFFAGHGLLDDQYRYYLGSHETNLTKLAATALPFDAIEGVFAESQSLHRVMLIDACHSGAVDPEMQMAGRMSLASGQVIAREARGAMSLDEDESEEKAASLQDSYEALRASFLDTRSSSGASIIAASGGLQFAFENDRVTNGLFTHALLDGLRSGKSDRNGDARIELGELFQYVASEVTKLSSGRQVPSIRSEPLYSRFTLR